MDQANQPCKAYKNPEFLNSPDARIVRILCEYLEPLKRFCHTGVKDTIVFFGSSRAPSKRQLRAMLKQETITESERKVLEKLCKYREEAVELSRRLTRWSLDLDHDTRFLICSGGGPGIMEAANEGASLAGGKSIGLNISLPVEQKGNSHITKEFNFEFHYFFMRKFWFAYLAKALIVFPGGFGTMDELFEILTLIQTQKLQKDTAVVIYGAEYWNDIVNFKKMLEWGTIREQDLELFKLCDTPDEAFEYITGFLRKHYLEKPPQESEMTIRCLKHTPVA